MCCGPGEADAMAGSPTPHENRAFDALLALADQATRHARGLPAQVDIQPHWSGIGFSLNGCPVVAPMGEIVELLPVPTATRLPGDRKSTRLNSSHVAISYAVFC